MNVEPFAVTVPPGVLDDLRTRIRNTRWPGPSPAAGWEQGTELGWLRDLLAYWAVGFDWPARERELNRFAHFRAELDGVRIHFVHERARDGAGIPLVLCHGWPSTFAELLPLVPLLTEPESGPSFDVVIPSLPGYPFSERPARTGVTVRGTAALWHQLMRGLGYERYGAQGGDFGAGVASWMALDNPAPMIGLYLSNLELAPWLGEGSRPLTGAERAYADRQREWDSVERGYSSIQSTKPQTVGYALNDSPAGLAAWVLEKWRSWTDSGGDLDGHLSRDFLLTMLTLFWASGSFTETLRDYWDNRWHGDPIGPGDFVHVPTGFGGFDNHLVPEGEPPREWVERLYDVRRFTPMPSGGHFAAAEEPERVARDIGAFFAAL